MKTLILSCNNGGGHNSVAAAIKEVYKANGQNVDIIDGMLFLPDGWSKLVSDMHSFVYRYMPELSREGYHQADVHRQQFARGHAARSVIDLGARKLAVYIQSHNYDQVICCHVFAGLMLTDAIRRYRLSIASAIVETDYTVTPGSEKCHLDWHFVPSEKQKAELETLYGVSKECIEVTGIPVRDQFMHSISKAEAKEKLGLDTQKYNIVVACGSMGCGPMDSVLTDLAKKQGTDPSFSVSVLCGSNVHLREHLLSLYRDQKDIHIFGRIEDMSTVLDSADVYMTKPGGISTSEASIKKLPMVLIDTVGGCEKYNLDFFVNRGGALTGRTIEDLTAAAIRICQDSGLHQKMEDALSKVSFENDQQAIYKNMLASSKSR